MLENDKTPFTLNIVANNSLITPNVGMSGGDRIFLELIRNLSKRQISINLFTGVNVLEFIKKNNCGKVYPFLFSKKSLSVYKNLLINSLIKIFLGAQSALKYRHKKNNILVIYSASDFWPDVIPAFIMKLKNKHSVWIGSFYQLAPTPWQENSPYKGKAWLGGVVYWLMQQPMYWLIRNFADIVFVTSSPDVACFPDHQKKENYFVVQGGVDINPSVKYFEKNTNDEKYYDACFIGRLHPQKGVIELIDIWRMVTYRKTNAKLAIIGNGPLKKELENKIKKLGLESNIDLLGFLDGEKKYKVFKASKIVLHPAIYDSGGMAAAEAMAWGLPGISFDLESLKTYYPQGMLKINKGNLKLFANSILLFLENDLLRKKVSNEALELIRSQWSWDKRIDEIYQFILNKSFLSAFPCNRKRI